MRIAQNISNQSWVFGFKLNIEQMNLKIDLWPIGGGWTEKRLRRLDGKGPIPQNFLDS